MAERERAAGTEPVSRTGTADGSRGPESAADDGRPAAPWSVYIVRCRDGSLYTGIATDVARRLAEHRTLRGKGAKYLRGRGPLRLVFVRQAPSREVALRLERRIKRLSKARKEEMVAHSSRGLPMR